MDQNQPLSAEPITPSATPSQNDKQPSLNEKTLQKSNKLATVITSCLAILFAVVAIVFAYLYFTTPTTPAQSDSTTSSSTQTDSDISDDTMNNTITEITIDEISTVLQEKYKFMPITYSYILNDGIYRFQDDFNAEAKLIFTIQQSDDILGDESDTDDKNQYTREISYNDLNARYKYYFGDASDLEKKSYEKLNSASIIKTAYMPEEDKVIIYYKDGLGGWSSIRQLNKIVNVNESNGIIKATIASVILSNIASQSIDKPLGQHGGSDGVMTHYDIYITDDELEKIRESLSVHEFNFIIEDGEFKLISINTI